jgi:hypothetical protein
MTSFSLHEPIRVQHIKINTLFISESFFRIFLSTSVSYPLPIASCSYAICPMVARGAIFGPTQPVILHLLDIEPAAQALEGVKMELLDAALPLLQGVVVSTKPEEACKDVDVAIMVGGFPRKAGMERKDVMSKVGHYGVSLGGVTPSGNSMIADTCGAWDALIKGWKALARSLGADVDHGENVY